jgi:1D-myo-inositol 3-kinase
MVEESPLETLEILIVGNHCHDTLIGGSGSHSTLGGSAAYASAILTALGARFDVVANVGEDFLYRDDLPRAPRILPGRRTTRFVHEYRASGERTSIVEARCEEIHPEDIGRAAIVGLAGAVAGEISPATLLRIGERTRFVACDVQGLIRVVEPATGRVDHVPLSETPFAPVLDAIDFLKISADEARFVDLSRLGPRTCPRTCVLLTEGAHGCRIVENGRDQRVPAFPAVEEDSTGAGDCFLAGFAFGIARGLDLPAAARLGNFCGALAVSQVGIPHPGSGWREQALAG